MHEGHDGMVQETTQEILNFPILACKCPSELYPFFILFRAGNHYLLNLVSYLHIMYIHVAKKQVQNVI